MRIFLPWLVPAFLAAGLLTGCESPKVPPANAPVVALFGPNPPATNSITHTVAPVATNFPGANRLLLIDPSSMMIDGGKVRLIVGTLRRAQGVYTGDYTLKVFPYFFENEKGRLAINVSDDSQARINQGMVTAISGTATASGQGGRYRHIQAMATPVNTNHGKLRLWFMEGDRLMILEPAYHFAVSEASTTRPRTAAATP